MASNVRLVPHPICVLILLLATQLLIPNTLNAQLTVSPSSLSFGDCQLGSLSPAQTIFVSDFSRSLTYAITGADTADFISAFSDLDVPEITVAFLPRFPGMKSASLTITDTLSNISFTVPLTGNALLSGTFHIVASFSAKVLDLATDTGLDETLVVQRALNGQPQQGWKFVPTDGGYYEIVNSVTGKVLDVTGESTADGARIQEYDYWGGGNQQWQLKPVDDVHFQIVNRLSGKSLDVTNGSTLDETPVQQWTYLGDSQQLWAIIPANPRLIGNSAGEVLDVLDGSTANQVLIQQWSSNGNPQQQWEFMPVGGGYYAVVNSLSGKVLDVIGASTSQGTLIQQYDYLGSLNQQWQFVPYIPSGIHGLLQINALDYYIVNRQSGMDLDGSGSDGTLVAQSQTGNGWQLVPIYTYLVQNASSNLVLDVPGGSSASGTVIQQWASNGNLQQQWQAIPQPYFVQIGLTRFPDLPGAFYSPMIFVNLLTGKALDVVGSSTANQALIEQSDLNGSVSQQWGVLAISGSTGLYQVSNGNSGKALDDTNASTSNGTLIQQYDYWGGLNQQWRFVPVSN